MVNQRKHTLFHRKNEEALKCIDKALKIDPDNGEVLAFNGNFEEAWECINKAIS